jgi:hypothetical protein
MAPGEYCKGAVSSALNGSESPCKLCPILLMAQDLGFLRAPEASKAAINQEES